MKKHGWATATVLLLIMLINLMFSDRNDVTGAANVVNTFNSRSGNVTLTSSDVTDALTFAPSRQADLTATNTNLADNYFTKSTSDSRFAPLGQVVTSLNNLTGGVTLNAGSNITLTPNGNTLTIASNQATQPYINPLRVATLQWYEANQTGLSYPVMLAPNNLTFDGENLWITGSSINAFKLRVADGAVVGTFNIQEGMGGGMAFDGAHIWIPALDDCCVVKMRASDGVIVGSYNLMPLTVYPKDIAFDGTYIWVISDKVVKLRASDGALVGSFNVGFDSNTGKSIAFDGANIWVTSPGPDTVTKLRATDGAVLGTFCVGSLPQDIAFDGANIWVTNRGSNSVTKLRASDGVLLGAFTVGNQPWGIAFDGANIWVANMGSNSVTKLRASDGNTLGTFTVGSEPTGLAFDGANIWVANAGSNSVSKL
jgi:hypothetical protein